MLGLFDSGNGGLNTVRYIKEHAPEVDLVYLIDRRRAPYGTKSEKELVGIADENIKRLVDMGAERVLIACCTASTVHPLLPSETAHISLPIISAVADEARRSTRSRRIGVIATEHTVKSHAFRDALPDCEVYEHAAQWLVGAIDGGLCDGSVTASDVRKIENMLGGVLNNHPDTLVLGCTHFPAVAETVAKIASAYGIGNVIDSARVGAELLIKEAKKLTG